MNKKIVVMGPESTGKSTLCAALAAHYSTLWAKEYAREYLETHGTDYSYEQLAEIAQGQLRNEDEAMQKLSGTEKPLIVDTDMYVMKVWSEFVYNKCENHILQQIAARKYDLYLLCSPDLPWVKDQLREYPDLETRKKLFCYYKDALVWQHVPWVEITGINEERTAKAIAAIDALLAQP